MQKNFLFVVSHLGSEYESLLEILNHNKRVVVHNTVSEYNHPDSLQWLVERGHKDDTTGVVYGDSIVYNMQISNKEFYKFCKFIYLIRRARPSLNSIVFKHDYAQKAALRYYTYRLRRICEMAKRTENAVLLTWDDLSDGYGYDLIEDYLCLKDNLKPNVEAFAVNSEVDNLSSDIVKPGDESYERHIFYLKQLNHLRMVERQPKNKPLG